MAEGILNPIPQLEADFDFDVYTKQEVDALLDEKADKSDTYTKTETDALLDEKADADAVYTKTETDTLLSAKADADNVYTKTETNNLLNGKADKSTTLAGYGITDAYTKTQMDNLLNAKANADSVYTKAEIDTELTVTKDGTWVKGTQTTATNLQKLEGGIEYLYGLLSHQYDQLKKYINGNYYDYDTDTDSKYTKTVLAGAMPYASLDSIGGKTLVWNQLCGNINATQFITKVTDGHYVVNGNPAYYTPSFIDENGNIVKSVSGHKYFIRFNCDEVNITLFCGTTVLANSSVSLTNSSITTINSVGNLMFRAGNSSGTTTYTNSNVYATIVDLTLLYGAGNEPSTVAEFTAQFPANYYPYNAGTLLSAGVTEVKSVGKNLADISIVKAFYPSLVTIVSADEFTFVSSNSMSATNRFFDNVEKRSGQMSISYSVNYNSTTSRGVYLRVYYTDGSFDRLYNSTAMNTWQTVSRTSSATKTVDYVAWSYENANVLATFKDLQIEWNTTATSYSPYKEISMPIPAEVQALEGYGWSAGSVYNYVDFERKVFVKRVASVDLGSLTWTTTGLTNPKVWKTTNALTDAKAPTTPYGVPNAISSKYMTNSYLYTGGGDRVSGNITIIFATSGDAKKVYVCDDGNYADATAFKSAMSGVYMYYELATPQEIDISAYLTDDNLISVESGGSLTFPNSNGTDYQIPVPSAETYMVDLQSAL